MLFQNLQNKVPSEMSFFPFKKKKKITKFQAHENTQSYSF